jgi:hypothetical protein
MHRHRRWATGVAMLLGVTLAVAACGTETSGPEQTVGTTATEPTTTDPSTTEPSTTQPTTEPTDDVMPTLAPGSDEVLALVLGRLDTATMDGRSQCVLDPDDITGQIGLRKSIRWHMLADGHDVWVVCLTHQSGPTGSTLSLTDSTGTLWGQGALAQLPETAAERSIGFGLTGTSVRPVTVTVGASLVPVGFSYQRDGHTVTALMVQVPTTRPAGPWSIAVTGPDGTDRVQLDTYACQPSSPSPVRPWPIRADLRVITWADLKLWYSDPTPEMINGFVPVQHCLGTPLLHGQPWDQAVSELEATRQKAGLPPADVELSLFCEPSAGGAVLSQFPEPNGHLNESASLHFEIPCPEMIDVVGQTVTQAEQTLATLEEPPFSFSARISPQCLGPDSIVTSTWPPATGTSYLADRATLGVDLFCSPGLSGGG